MLDGQAAINLNSAEPGLFWRLTNGQLAKAGPVAITDNGLQPNSAPAGETGNAVGEEWLDAHSALHSPILHIFNGTEFVTANGFTVDKSTGNLTHLRELEVTKLVAGAGEVNGPLVVGGNITPHGQNCAFYLGLPTERWDYLYACNLDVSGDVNFGSGDITLGDGCNTSTIDLNGAVTLSCDMMPDADNLRDIGSSTNKLKAIYSTDVFSGDLNMKNDRGDFTLVEEADYLSIRNNKTGKTYRLVMEEV